MKNMNEVSLLRKMKKKENIDFLAKIKNNPYENLTLFFDEKYLQKITENSNDYQEYKNKKKIWMIQK